MTVLGYGTADPTTPLSPVQFERPDARPGEIAIEVTHCGVCHSDVHQCHDDWGNTVWAMDEINEAFERVMNEDIRFRHVIDMASLTSADPSEATSLDAPVRGLPEDGGEAPLA